jgi:hypothetical protein
MRRVAKRPRIARIITADVFVVCPKTGQRLNTKVGTIHIHHYGNPKN